MHCLETAIIYFYLRPFRNLITPFRNLITLCCSIPSSPQAQFPLAMTSPLTLLNYLRFSITSPRFLYHLFLSCMSPESPILMGRRERSWFVRAIPSVVEVRLRRRPSFSGLSNLTIHPSPSPPYCGTSTNIFASKKDPSHLLPPLLPPYGIFPNFKPPLLTHFLRCCLFFVPVDNPPLPFKRMYHYLLTTKSAARLLESP